MGMTDPISDMLSRIRNAQTVKKKHVNIPHSKIKQQIGEILRDEGYIESVKIVEDKNSFKSIDLELKYFKNRPVIEELKRASSPGKRLYVGKEEIPVIYQGLGISILSTNKGVLSSRKAREIGVGGELICTVF